MAIIIVLVLILLLLLITVILSILFARTNQTNCIKLKQLACEIYKKRNFEVDSLLVVSKKMIIALNKQLNKLALIEDLNPVYPDTYKYKELKTSSVTGINDTKFFANLNIIINGITNTISVPSISKEGKEFFHNLLAKTSFKKLELFYPDFHFSDYTSSNWECDYVWAYDKVKSGFAYISTKDKNIHHILNLRKEFVTIDTKYNYLELPMMGEARQLMVYDNSFLKNMFCEIHHTIKTYITSVFEDKIFYDNYSNILYLSDGISSFQTIIIDKIDDVFYRENKLQFTKPNSGHIINFNADKEFINEFEKFVINYNLRKIANNFDYKTDKLLNVGTNTKFIIDITRDRMVYCANLNKFHNFSYMTISFSNLKSAEVIKNATKCYIRIKTKDDEVLDVTCLKSHVAYYVKAQIDLIVAQG